MLPVMTRGRRRRSPNLQPTARVLPPPPSFSAETTGGEGSPAVPTGCPADSDPPGPLPISPCADGGSPSPNRRPILPVGSVLLATAGEAWCRRATEGSCGVGAPAPWSCSRPLIALLALSAHVQLTLVFGGAAPDPVHLPGSKRELEALAAHPAGGADFLGPGYLVPARPARGHREEKLRVRLQAGGRLPPVTPLLRRRSPLPGHLGNNHEQTPESV
jgi:hypothetical protein